MPEIFGAFSISVFWSNRGVYFFLNADVLKLKLFSRFLYLVHYIVYT